ncbi:integral membrane permease [Streptomyces albus]|uniref:Integral membrane permease n=1 Tax=Streptomyces albus (strain ATCC 21838 / DSM 41398 / FERM P-419 / JCM 4703 / NBRC 107858) TaxID=1081613 RepID=A0A0B5EQV8_STRA4|nr:integral membrane permease [Streptomyces albus]AOU79500.1 integral membrane permease [Streptomyces albus]AYN35224.1 membrane protein [Streptomyces albus]
MQGVLSGFAVITVVIAVGYLIGRRGHLGENGPEVLTRLAFHVATPALLFTTLSRADLSVILSGRLLITALCTAATAGVFVAVGALRGWGVGRTTIGALCSSYLNAGNLGIPIAAYVLGDASLIAPVLLFQQILVTPLALTVLDLSGSGAGAEVGLGSGAGPGSGSGGGTEAGSDTNSEPGSGSGSGGKDPLWKRLTTPLRNPLALSSLAGVAVAATGWSVPGPLGDPVALIGNMSIPAVLLALGISLRGSSLPGGPGPDRLPVLLSTALKSVGQPLLAWFLAAEVFGLDGEPLLQVVVVAALPAAQNMFTYASRYQVGERLARESILLSTLASAPVMVGVAAVLG